MLSSSFYCLLCAPFFFFFPLALFQDPGTLLSSLLCCLQGSALYFSAVQSRPFSLLLTVFFLPLSSFSYHPVAVFFFPESFSATTLLCPFLTPIVSFFSPCFLSLSDTSAPSLTRFTFWVSTLSPLHSSFSLPSSPLSHPVFSPPFLISAISRSSALYLSRFTFISAALFLSSHHLLCLTLYSLPLSFLSILFPCTVLFLFSLRLLFLILFSLPLFFLAFFPSYVPLSPLHCSSFPPSSLLAAAS